MLTPDEVRRMALALPEAEEKSNFDVADFRVRNKIFATLWPDGLHAMLKLSREDQAALTSAEPETFFVPRGGTGGATAVVLDRVDAEEFHDLLRSAWRGRAPKRLHSALEVWPKSS